MEKKLSDRIAAVAKTEHPGQKARRWALFLAQKGEILEAIADGWAVRRVWQQLRDEKKIDVTYQSFLRWVKAVQASPTAPAPSAPSSAASIEHVSTPVPPAPRKPRPASRPDQARNFNFPASVDTKELL